MKDVESVELLFTSAGCSRPLQELSSTGAARRGGGRGRGRCHLVGEGREDIALPETPAATGAHSLLRIHGDDL